MKRGHNLFCEMLLSSGVFSEACDVNSAHQKKTTAAVAVAEPHFHVIFRITFVVSRSTL